MISRLRVREHVGELVERTLNLQRITWRLALRHIHNPMHVEADLLRARRPSFITEAV